MLILGSRLTACAPPATGTRANGFAPPRELARTRLNGASHMSPDRSAMSAAESKFEEIEALGRGCRQGDLAAWNLLFPKIWPVLVTFVHRLYHSFEQQDA